MIRYKLVVTVICFIAYSALVSAQSSSSGQTTGASVEQQQTIRLDVLVRDKSGSLLTGLPEQAFTVRDSGQVEKLVSFKPIDTRTDPNAVHVLIMLDLINVGINTVAWAREQVGEYLKQDDGKLVYPSSIGVLDERGARVMNGSTTDGNALRAALQNMKSDLRFVNRMAGWEGRDDLMETSIQQFSQLLASERIRPGRKLILFISPGCPMLPNQGAEEFTAGAQWSFNVDVSLTNQIRDSRAAIYDLDTYDLGNRHQDEGAQDPFYYQSFLKPVTKWQQAQYPDLALGVFAIHSGGRVMVNGRRISGEIDDAMRDAGSYYEMTYAAPPDSVPNQYHAIDVRVNQPGAMVQTLTGYYADPQIVGPQPKQKKKR